MQVLQYMMTNLDSLQYDNGEMRSQIDELQSWVASRNQAPVNVSVAQGTKISQLTINNSGMMGGGNPRR